MTDAAANEIPAKPYLLRALYEWCADNGYTPYLSVRADEHCRIPQAHVKDGHITLNIGMMATHNLALGNDFIEFSARFNGVAQQVSVPVTAVVALYARETQQGMGFEAEPFVASAQPAPAATHKPAHESTHEPAHEPTEPTRPRFQFVT